MNALTLSARTNPDLKSLAGVREWWQNNRECNNHSMTGGSYANRKDCERYGTKEIHFRYKDLREVAILTLSEGNWFINAKKFCRATETQKV